MRRTLLGGLFWVVVLLVSACISIGDEATAATDTIKIAAFNIEIFGPATCANANVMDILAQIAREFDVLFVQEIRNVQMDIATCYLTEINELEGPGYKFVESERLGGNREAYAYFYNTETVFLVENSAHVWHDPDDVFDREPYIATFRSGNFDFTLAGIHVKPQPGVTAAEIGKLADVFTSILAQNPAERDIIVLGDLNADGRYFDEDGDSPLKTEQFSWVITNDMDTMTKTDWTYDRIVMMDSTLEHEYVDNSAAVFYFDEKYGIDDQGLISEVSDHYPVYAEFRTDLPDDDPVVPGCLPSSFRTVTTMWGYAKL